MIRIYTLEHPDDPQRVFTSTNQRILDGADSGLFVTVFFGILNSTTGEFVYMNAGHNPPFTLKPGLSEINCKLDKTGMAIGVMEGENWELRQHYIEPGEIVILYTDGITDAVNKTGEFYSLSRLEEVAMLNEKRTAGVMKEAIIEDLERFVGDLPQIDDITILVVKREEGQ